MRMFQVQHRALEQWLVLREFKNGKVKMSMVGSGIRDNIFDSFIYPGTKVDCLGGQQGLKMARIE